MESMNAGKNGHKLVAPDTGADCQNAISFFALVTVSMDTCLFMSHGEMLDGAFSMYLYLNDDLAAQNANAVWIPSLHNLQWLATFSLFSFMLHQWFLISSTHVDEAPAR